MFTQAIRIIKEMREKSNGEYPRIAVWENVPGAFSSAKGEDFRAVLEAFCKIADENADVPRPANGKWSYSGEIVGDRYSVAWRTLDAQYWGVPQRRRRIFLVADFRGECAAEILFKREGLSRNFAESRKAWQGITKSLAFGTGTESGNVILTKEYGISSYESNSMKSSNPHSGVYEADTAKCLDLNGGNPACNQGGIAIVAIEGNGSRPSHQGNGYSEDGVSYTLNSVEKHGVCCLNPWDAQSARVYAAEGVWHSLNANENGGQSRDAVLAFACNQRDEVRDLGDKAGDIQAQPGMKQQTFIASFMAGQGAKARGVAWRSDGTTPTLKSTLSGSNTVPTVLIYDTRGNGDGEISPTITGDHENRVTDYTAIVCGVDGYNTTLTGGQTSTLGVNCGISTGRNGVLAIRERCGCDGGGKGCLVQENMTGDSACHNDQFLCYCVGNGQADSIGLHSIPSALNCMHDQQAVLCVALDRAAFNQGQNAQYNPGIDGESGKAFTVVAKGPGAVCYPINTMVATRGGKDDMRTTFGVGEDDDPQFTLSSAHEHAVCYLQNHTGGAVLATDYNGVRDKGYAQSNNHKEPQSICYLVPVEIILRRLTPTECARLQGMPDWWCDDIPHSDAAEYKMWGNGVALPCVIYVMEGIRETLGENT